MIIPPAGGRARTALYLLSGLGIVLGLAALAGLAAFRDAPPPRLANDLELVEEATEDLANALLDLSLAVRDGRSAEMEALFASRLMATPFPAVATPLAAPATEDVPWVRRHGWTHAVEPREMWHTDMVASISAFRRHFSVVEDVRFKVKSSTVAVQGSPVEAVLAFWVVGRDAAGHREWVRGEALGVARRAAPVAGPAATAAPGAWRLERFVFTSLESMIAERDLFTEVAADAGLAATDPPVLEHPLLGLTAYGAATADLDRDGRLDLVVTGQAGNALYLHSGDGTFRDVAAAAGVRTLPTPAHAPLLVDYDNDGDQDLFLSAVGDQALFENRMVPDGRLAFRDVSLAAGVALPAAGFSSVSGDVNGDGFPDIYVTSYNHYGQVLPDAWDGATNGLPNLLFVNQRNGTFREAAAAWGVADRRWSYAAQFADIDEDGDLDLYVANDFGGGNGLFMNTGERFVDGAAARGVVDQAYGMGVSFGDHDNDGDLDLHVTRLSSTEGRRILGRLSAATFPAKDRLLQLRAGNALYENRGGGHFRDVSAAAGPFLGGWAWGGGFFDFDNDSWLDLFTPNGFLSGVSLRDTSSLFWRQVVAGRVGGTGRGRSARLPASPGGDDAGRLLVQRLRTRSPGAQPGRRNLSRHLRRVGSRLPDRRPGRSVRRFRQRRRSGRLPARHARSGAPPAAQRGRPGQPLAAHRARGAGQRPGRLGRHRTPQDLAGVQTRLKSGGDGYLAQSDPRLLFGLGAETEIEGLEVVWPSGQRQRFPGPEPNSSWLLIEGEASLRRVREPAVGAPRRPTQGSR